MRQLRSIGLAVALALVVGSPLFAQSDGDRHPGQVDAEVFYELAGGEDAIRLEVQLHGVALKILGEMDNAIGDIAKGLESVRAVILDMDQERLPRARDAWKRIQRRLLNSGWNRLAMVREDQEEIHVLVLEDAGSERIEGLTVVILDRGEGQLIFTNIVGAIDFEALRRIAATADIPGLDVLGDVQ